MSHFRATPRQPEGASGRAKPDIFGVFLGFAAALTTSSLLIANGTGVWVFQPLLSLGTGSLGMIVASVAFVLYLRLSAEHRALQSVRVDLGEQTRVDTLTGLLNRGAFLGIVEGVEPAPGAYTCVLFFDLDRFKDVNDTLGHLAGDQVLVQVARRCAPILGTGVPFARLGGDEFAALLPYDACRPPEVVGRAIVEALAQPIAIDGKLVSIGASVGVAVGNLASEGADELLRRADLAMYEAKKSGRGACRIYDDALSSDQRQKGIIRVELARPDIASEFTMVYQPLVDARSGALSSVEALLRWRSGQLGDVSPSMLIPIAEECGFIDKITDWTLDQALAAVTRMDGASVAINISPVVFRHPDFTHRIFDRLLTAKVRPELLTLEITEGVLISDIERSQCAINRLRGIGVRIVLDDFGTGYSSLSYLQNFSLDGLKLDKSFLRNVGSKRQATQIIRTMIDFGHSLDMKVVVEGVENEWQIRLLQLVGCDLLQGYAIGAPMSLEDLVKFRPQEALSGCAPDAALASEFALRLTA